MLKVKKLLVTKMFFRLGFDTKLVFFCVENRNHVWRDLFRLVDVESKGIAGN